jgi:inorganic pyrophosphatase
MKGLETKNKKLNNSSTFNSKVLKEAKHFFKLYQEISYEKWKRKLGFII